MKKLAAIVILLLGLTACASMPGESPLNYDQLVILDAEELAEGGIKDAYEQLIPTLKMYVPNPAELVEIIDNNLPRYSVSCSGITYDIYSPSMPDSRNESWGRATYAFFSIINNQLKRSAVKFYAVNGGNDLDGMFLTEAQLASAKKGLKNKTDWPYLPTIEHPWYGQYHSDQRPRPFR